MNLTIYTEKNLRDFKNSEFNIEYIFFDPCMEEDTVTSVDDKSNKMNFAQKIKGKIEKLIKELIAIVDRFFEKVRNTLIRFAQTDTGFNDTIRKAISNNAPLEAVKLITYNYNNNFLDTQMNIISNACLSIITDLKSNYAKDENSDSSNPLDMDKENLYNSIFKKANVSSDVTSLSTYFEFLKKGFRVEKKEILFTASKRTEYYNITNSRNKIEKIIYSKQKVLKNQISIIKNLLTNITNNPNTQNEIKNRALRQSANVTHVYNFYTSFLDMYLQLKIEYMLTYRVVLKKLYHI